MPRPCPPAHFLVAIRLRAAPRKAIASRIPAPVLMHNSIKAQLERILNSHLFSGAHRSQLFLRYIVDHALARPASHSRSTASPSMSSIVMPPTIPPSTPPCGSKPAGSARVCSSTTPAKARPIAFLIEIPRGGYRAVFRPRQPARRFRSPATRSRARETQAFRDSAPASPLVRPGSLHSRSPARPPLLPLKPQSSPLAPTEPSGSRIVIASSHIFVIFLRLSFVMYSRRQNYRQTLLYVPPIDEASLPGSHRAARPFFRLTSHRADRERHRADRARPEQRDASAGARPDGHRERQSAQRDQRRVHPARRHAVRHGARPRLPRRHRLRRGHPEQP